MSEEEKPGKKQRIGGIGRQQQAYGTVGGGRRSFATEERSDVQQSERPAVQESDSPAGQQSRVLDTQSTRVPAVQTAKGDRVQQTAYLPRALAKWLRHQAIEEEREIGEIVADALEAYRQSLPR